LKEQVETLKNQQNSALDNQITSFTEERKGLMEKLDKLRKEMSGKDGEVFQLRSQV